MLSSCPSPSPLNIKISLPRPRHSLLIVLFVSFVLLALFTQIVSIFISTSIPSYRDNDNHNENENGDDRGRGQLVKGTEKSSQQKHQKLDNYHNNNSSASSPSSSFSFPVDESMFPLLQYFRSLSLFPLPNLNIIISENNSQVEEFDAQHFFSPLQIFKDNAGNSPIQKGNFPPISSPPPPPLPLPPHVSVPFMDLTSDSPFLSHQSTVAQKYFPNVNSNVDPNRNISLSPLFPSVILYLISPSQRDLSHLNESLYFLCHNFLLSFPHYPIVLLWDIHEYPMWRQKRTMGLLGTKFREGETEREIWGKWNEENPMDMEQEIGENDNDNDKEYKVIIPSLSSQLKERERERLKKVSRRGRGRGRVGGGMVDNNPQNDNGRDADLHTSSFTHLPPLSSYSLLISPSLPSHFTYYPKDPPTPLSSWLSSPSLCPQTQIFVYPISLSYPKNFDHFSPRYSSQNNRWRKGKKRSHRDFSYNHMIRFWAMGIFTLPLWGQTDKNPNYHKENETGGSVPSFDYFMRLDTDSLLLSPLVIDPFMAMASHREKIHYAYFDAHTDYVEVTKGLLYYAYWYGRREGEMEGEGEGKVKGIVRKSLSLFEWPLDFSTYYSTHHSLSLPSPSKFNVSSLPLSIALSSVPIFYNNLEILSPKFFISHPSLCRFLDSIDNAGYQYEFRWGDAPIRYVGLLLYGEERNTMMVGVGYSHQGERREVDSVDTVSRREWRQKNLQYL